MDTRPSSLPQTLQQPQISGRAEVAHASPLSQREVTDDDFDAGVLFSKIEGPFTGKETFALTWLFGIFGLDGCNSNFDKQLLLQP